ncbi:MAG TPA: hypothetical protein VGK74_20575 [Symbiobacteriaceae bacterium]|jgi:hypothetical protein
MFTPYRLLTWMLLTAGEIRGRKKLQKMVFIAQSLGYSFTEPFDLHVWGPYSETLAVKLKEMTDWGFAREEVLPGPAGNHHYIYTPGHNAAQAVRGPEAEAVLPTELVLHLNAQDATLLEGVATVLYLRSKGQDGEAAGETLARLKPDKFSDPARVRAAGIFAEELEAYRIS